MWWGVLLALVGIVGSLVAHTPAVSAADDCPSALPTATVERLRGGLTAGSVWGLSADEAAWVLFPVTKDRALPADYVPTDLVRTTTGGDAPQGAQPLRRLIVPDLEALFAAARGGDVSLGILSAYRSYDTQESLFRAGVGQQITRASTARPPRRMLIAFGRAPGIRNTSSARRWT
jgi:D-alanyl-D-alanine carboxypeptidase